MSREVWFWQRIISPHMMGLAKGLSSRGCKLVYVAEQQISADRAALGWESRVAEGVDVRIADDHAAISRLVDGAAEGSIHICQGVRSNGLINDAQRLLAQRGLRQWIVMETVDDAGMLGVIKRLEYSRRFLQIMQHAEGILATGYKTRDWIIDRGVEQGRVVPFAYFLSSEEFSLASAQRPLSLPSANSVDRPLRFLFVGRFCRGKRLDLLIDALAPFSNRQLELWVVGSGELESQLRRAAFASLKGKVKWIGQLPASQVPRVMRQADCLVLPSDHDGWGAVVSEAIMMGTPAICSDACGVAGVVKASGAGGVFSKGRRKQLEALLSKVLELGPVREEARQNLSAWGRCLGGDVGAMYLLAVLEGQRPPAPWYAVERKR